ncbi:MAG TPA: endonuclease/exonuclease/phosphatase family protein [Solirubrobacteraceae bacterium]|jgi:exonuclease III|nr:endonuclease/exonuclease/phosphatase family protein [Solirubrobacteraceae bacterium]
MLIVSWNIAGRVKCMDAQAKLLLALGADIVCLQELTPTTLPTWQARLQAAGYHTLSAPEPPPDSSRRLSVLSAARAPLRQLALPELPWPERALATCLPDGCEILNLHSPTSPKPALAKIRTHEAVFAHLAVNAPGRLRLLCGDFNTPRREHPDGTIWTFARDQYGRLRPERGERWDRAELALISGLDAYGFRDAFRAMHGYGRRQHSWEWRRWRGGYRLDHLLLSGPWKIARCDYLHAFRKSGLSDHSALIAELQPETSSEASGVTQRTAAGNDVLPTRESATKKGAAHD